MPEGEYRPCHSMTFSRPAVRALQHAQNTMHEGQALTCSDAGSHVHGTPKAKPRLPRWACRRLSCASRLKRASPRGSPKGTADPSSLSVQNTLWADNKVPCQRSFPYVSDVNCFTPLG